MAAEANERLQAVFRLRSKFLDASDEEQVVEAVLDLAVTITPATGASYVPLDDRGQPMPAITVGSSGPGVPDAWIEYLATPAVRDRCKVCEKHGHFSRTCPLLKGPFSEGLGLYCLPLKRGDREFGVLNLYFEEQTPLTLETQSFLQSIVQEAALALEGIWLRKRELVALRQLQSVRQKTDLKDLFSDLLENVYLTLEVDFALLVVQLPGDNSSGGEKGGSEQDRLLVDLVKGEVPASAKGFVDSILQGVIKSGEPVLIGSVSGDLSSPAGARSLMAAPLLSATQTPLGALLAGNRRAHNFGQRQLALLQTLAGQMALVVQNTQQLAELEYKTMIDERIRLAREIHDGLAQTLGFLKLQAAQMQTYLERGDAKRLEQSFQVYYKALAEAYQDARYAIDGLRISPTGEYLTGWMEQLLAEFQENVDPQTLQVTLTCLQVEREIAPEVQAQLIRILQEALVNVRKHSGARNAWVSCCEKNSDVILEVSDDGIGFTPEDVSGPSQHGLRGMRERAELIGADFQIISKPDGGTIIRVSMPADLGEKVL